MNKNNNFLGKEIVPFNEFNKLYAFDERAEYLYNIFYYSECDNNYLKEILKHINFQEISCCFFGALESKKENIINMLNQYFNNHYEGFSNKDANILFNCALENSNYNFINYLLNQKNIINEELDKNHYLHVDNDGKISPTIGFSLDFFSYFSFINGNYKKFILKYNKTKLDFAIDHLNEKHLNFILDKNNNIINNSVVENIFINLILNKQDKKILFILNHNKFNDIIKNSEKINLVLSEKTQSIETKEKIKAFSFANELKEIIDVNDSNKKEKIIKNKI